nr:Triple gene block 3 Protein [Narcissus mosaic virus]
MQTAPREYSTSGPTAVPAPTTNTQHYAPYSLYRFLSSHKLDLLLGIAVLVFLYVITAAPKEVCQVVITGESVVIRNCQQPDRILANLNLSPWNGVKFPLS